MNVTIKLLNPGEGKYKGEINFKIGDRIYLYVWDNGMYEGDLAYVTDREIALNNAQIIDLWNPHQVDFSILNKTNNFKFKLVEIYGIEVK